MTDIDLSALAAARDGSQPRSRSATGSTPAGSGGPAADERSAANVHVDRSEHAVTVKYPRPRYDEMIHCSPLTGISRSAPLLIFVAGSVGAHTDPRRHGVRFRCFTDHFSAVG